MQEAHARLDMDRPCLACGAPWLVEELPLWMEGRVVRRYDVDIGCSARCFDSDRHAYDRGLAQRHTRGWSPR